MADKHGKDFQLPHGDKSSPGVKEAGETQKGNEAEAREAAPAEAKAPLPHAPVPPASSALPPRSPAPVVAEGTLKQGRVVEGVLPHGPESVEVPSSPPDPGARAMLDSLLETGTPPKILADAERWLADPANVNATAEQLYRHMEAHGASGAEDVPSLGTLRKAGKFAFGEAYEPESGVLQAPGEELTALRAQNEQLRKTIEQEQAKRLGVVKQLDLANEAKNDAMRQLQQLKAGRSKKELKALGFDDDSPGVS